MTLSSNQPKIVSDLQSIITKLSKDFDESNEPITDNNQNLHRFCAKLEYLLSSCMKESTFLHPKSSYWYWINSCLRNKKGFDDGLKFVSANKQIKTSKGRGRALIRYWLVHQTLADCLQNCLLNDDNKATYLKPQAIIGNDAFSSVLLAAFYDLNTLYFDLNSQGYDLDLGWPTFASRKVFPFEGSIPCHMTTRSHFGSFESLGTASSLFMEPATTGYVSRQGDLGPLNGVGKPKPYTDDKRIEELILELNQSDDKLKEQQEIINDLEMKLEKMDKSTNEKEDIFASVISDLETKNRHLHEVLSQMTAEFQSRDEQMSKKLADFTDTHKTLSAKAKQLEEDKHNLEELVSHQMTQMTSRMPSHSYATNELLTLTTAVGPEVSGDESSKDWLTLLEENKSLKLKLEKSWKECETLQNTLKENEKDKQVISELHNNITELQSTITKYDDALQTTEEKIKVKLYDKFQGHLLDKFKKILNLDNIPSSSSIPDQLEFAFKRILHLSEIQDSLNIQAQSAGTYYQMTSHSHGLGSADKDVDANLNAVTFGSSTPLLNKSEYSFSQSVDDESHSLQSDDEVPLEPSTNGNADVIPDGPSLYDELLESSVSNINSFDNDNAIKE